MAQKSKIRTDRLIILILVTILIAMVIALGIIKGIDLLSANKEKEDNSKPTEVVTTDGVKVSLIDSRAYVDDTDSLGFNFAIVTLKFESNSPISFDFSNLQTSEKIHLNDVSYELQKVKEEGYKLDEFNIVNSITSDANSIEVNVFVPYKTDDSTLSIYNLNDPTTQIVLDLDNNQYFVTSLKFDNESNIVVDNTSVVVSKSFISTRMKHNGEEYDIPSTNKVFTFIIFVNSVDENVSIVDAYFIKDGEDEKIPCMSSEYKSNKAENVIGENLTAGENGALFFETYCREDNPDYSGVLMLKFSNSDDWVKVNTTLE